MTKKAGAWLTIGDIYDGYERRSPRDSTMGIKCTF